MYLVERSTVPLTVPIFGEEPLDEQKQAIGALRCVHRPLLFPG